MKKIFTLLAVLVLFLNGKSQTTLSFDGTDDYVAINKSYSSPISALTAEVWFKTSFTTAGDFSNWALICFDRSEYWHFSIEGDGRIGFHSTSVTGATDDFWSSANSALVNGTWHHAAVVFDGTDKIIYVDGVEVARKVNAHAGGNIGRSGVTRFGFLGDGSEADSFNSTTNEYYYDGMMTEARVWSVARTASEILANYNTALTGNETNLDIYYNFSEGSGATLNDLSSVGYDGTIFGATWVTDNAPITSCSLSVNAGADQTVCAGGPVTLSASSTAPPATDLFISEYSEGSSNNKYIEIFNGTDSDVDLSNYEMWKIENGGNWTERILTLSGTLAAGEVYVIYNSSSAGTIVTAGDLIWTQANYNGDDAIGLAKSINGTMALIDAVGTDGAAPGTAWGVAGVNNATKDHTLVRKSSVTGPNTNWTVSAGTNSTDSEWEVLAKDDWTNIGSHSYLPITTYVWDNSVTNGTAFTPTATTTYTVTGTDANGCIATDQVTVTVNALPTVTVNDATICAGDAAATFTATSSTATAWLWSGN